MANDRVYIQCLGCHGWKMLLKYYPSDGLTTRDNGILGWLDKHAECNPYCGHFNLNGYPGFRLVADSDPQASQILPAHLQHHYPIPPTDVEEA